MTKLGCLAHLALPPHRGATRSVAAPLCRPRRGEGGSLRRCAKVRASLSAFFWTSPRTIPAGNGHLPPEGHMKTWPSCSMLAVGTPRRSCPGQTQVGIGRHSNQFHCAALARFNVIIAAGFMYRANPSFFANPSFLRKQKKNYYPKTCAPPQKMK